MGFYLFVTRSSRQVYATEHMMPAINHSSLYQSGIQGSESIVILCPILNSSRHWTIASLWALIQFDNYDCKPSFYLNAKHDKGSFRKTIYARK